MNVIVTVENSMGILFNDRRLSRDIKMIDDMISIVGENRLWINDFSADVFAHIDLKNIIVDNNFLNKAGQNDFCLTENTTLSQHIDKIHRLYIYKWNRDYPHDTVLDINPYAGTFKKIAERDFAGKSHSKITLEEFVYEKK